MRAADYEPAWRAILEGGWNDFRLPLRFYLEYPPAHLLVAETAAGRIVGTASAIQHATTGWVGLVFVAPDQRGRGLGRRLTELAIDDLRRRGCSGILLAATELGLPIYERLGFVPRGGYTVLRGEAARIHVPTPGEVRALEPDDLAAVAGLDRQASGEDRRTAIRALGPPAGAGWALGNANNLRGYALRTPWSLGPAIAVAPDDGPRLLDVLLQHHHQRPQLSITVPTDNQHARAHLRQRGLVEERHLPRLVLGEPVPWQPQAMWAIFNFALG
jgi:GNAT superfamily N-acetyltransferase